MIKLYSAKALSAATATITIADTTTAMSQSPGVCNELTILAALSSLEFTFMPAFYHKRRPLVK